MKSVIYDLFYVPNFKNRSELVKCMNIGTVKTKNSWIKPLVLFKSRAEVGEFSVIWKKGLKKFDC